MKKIIILLLVFTININQAQIKKFGKISKDEFALKNNKKYEEDDAIELFKERKTTFEYYDNVGWMVVTKVHERILLKNKNGFKYATKKIKLFKSEKAKVKAATYNLDGDNIVITKLDNDDIYKQKITENWVEKKFTMPNLKEGSIIEWQYKIKSSYIAYIDDIVYQKTIPILYLDVFLTIPEYFKFKYYVTKYFPINLNIKTDAGETNHFSLVDVKAIKKEPFIPGINNYIGRVKFELVSVEFPGRPVEKYASSWEDVCKKIYKSFHFGDQLKKTGYFKKDLKNLTSQTFDKEVKTHKILDFVKKKVRWNNQYGIYSDVGVKKAYKTGKGNVAEINFILISMLNQAGIEAYPVLGSSIHHGIPMFPTIIGFNYVITAVKKGNGYILIDPTEKLAPPGVLPSRILNWFGRIVKKDGSSDMLELFPQYHSLSINTLIANIDDSKIKGYCKSKKTGNIALKNRKKYSGLNKEQIVEKLEKELENTSILNARINNIGEIENPLSISYQFEMEDALEEVGNKKILYPALFLKTKENPFKSENRKFPIYFGYPYIRSHVITIKIPDSYKIQKLPESVSYHLPDDMGSYTYKIEQTPAGIKLQISLKISKPVISVNNYKELKDFFEKIVTKENEAVILSK